MEKNKFRLNVTGCDSKTNYVNEHHHFHAAHSANLLLTSTGLEASLHA